jgi:hypothetical protein
MNREKVIDKLHYLTANKCFVEARNLCLDLIYTYPLDIEIWIMRGKLHLQLSEFASAAECMQCIIARLSSGTLFNPMLSEAYRILGTAYFRSGRVKDAISVFEHLIAEDPNDAFSHELMGFSQLVLGNFLRGWRERQWRFKIKGYMAEGPSNRPCWDGQPINGKTILVMVEQGHGDTVQFVRYLHDVKARGGTIVLACQNALRRLLAECASVDQVISRGDAVPPFDVAITLLSLPYIFQTSLDTIPAMVPYLHVPQGAGTQAIEIIARYKGVLRVGLVWAGNINHLENRHRSLALEQFRDLFSVAGTRFFSLQKFLSLQKDDAVAELKSIPQDIITDLDPYLGDFADTAAAIQALDLVISVDTAVAHVAGALAKPVWTLISFVPDWRWMLDRDDSPWYPTMRLFRQPTPGDWSSVITRVATQLVELVQQQSATDKDRESESSKSRGQSLKSTPPPR